MDGRGIATGIIRGAGVTQEDRDPRCLREEGKDVPEEIVGSVLYHCGPIMTEIDGKKVVVAAGPTTSARMNSTEAEMISRFHIRAIIGKGGLSPDVGKAMAEEGAAEGTVLMAGEQTRGKGRLGRSFTSAAGTGVYLSAPGGAAVTLAEGLYAVDGVEWEDLGMAEAMWKFRANKLGPLIVAMDAQGNSLYEKVNSSLKR